MKTFHDLEILQAELARKDAEVAERMAKWVNQFTKLLQQEFAPELSQPIPREFAPARPVSTLPQRKITRQKGGHLQVER